MPGGVNSPVRAFNSVGMSPLFMESGKGSKITDIDGNEYIDYVLSWGPLILGHADDQVIDTLKKTAEKGTSFGAPSLLENQLANLVMARVPSIEMMRMVNYGTEATMRARRLARRDRGRELIVKVDGSYHGLGGPVVVTVGAGVATRCRPDSARGREGVASSSIPVPNNRAEGGRYAGEQYGEK